MSKSTAIVLAASLLLIGYGYASQAVGLYFFWESAALGWVLFLVGVGGLLLDRIKSKQARKKGVVLERIGIGVAVVVLLIKGILFAVLYASDAYAVAKQYVAASREVQAEIGTVQGFGLVPSGAIQVATDSTGEHGNAAVNMIVKGDKKFKFLTVYAVKNADGAGWEVEGME